MSGGTSIDPSTLMVGASGLITALWAIRTSIAGRKNEARQQTAANELAEKAHAHDAQRDIIRDLERLNDRKDHEIERLIRDRTQDRLEQQGELSHLRDIIATLQSVANSELAKHLAQDGLDGSQHSPEPQPPLQH